MEVKYDDQMESHNSWLSLWEDIIENSSGNRRRRDISELEMLDIFPETSYTKDNKHICWENGRFKDDRIEKEFNRLKRFVNEDSSVLDIGAGLGRLAIPFAKIAKKVIAVEPSRVRMKLMRENAEREGVYNIEYINKLWNDVEVDGRCDLVLGTWSPAIRDPQSLAKMHNASKRYCCLELTATPPPHWEFYGKIYPHIMNEEYKHGTNYMHILTALYAHGIYANIETEKFEREIRYENMDETLDEWKRIMETYTEMTAEKEEKLRQYYRTRMAPDGSYAYSEKGVSCMLWWETASAQNSVEF